MNFNFQRNFWLKWYWPFIEPLYTVEGHFGTRASAKSHNIARKLLYHSFKPYQFNVIHSRKVYGDIEGSTFKLLTDLIYKYFPNDFIIKKDHFFIQNKHTKNWFRGLGMDKPEKAKAVEGANIAWMEEANQFEEADYDFISTTIRGEIGTPVSMILSWNPESQNHWLFSEYQRKKDLANHVFYKSTFYQNYAIDREEFHNRLLRIKSKGKEGERRYKVWAEGEWGIEDMDYRFAYGFNPEIHVKQAKIKAVKELPLYLSFDFNVTNTCGVQQFLKNGPGAKYYATINRIRTYRIGDLGALCDTILEDFKGFEFIINGDASGGNRSAFSQDNITAYQFIKKRLRVNDFAIQVPPANPSHIASRAVTNLVLQNCLVQIAEENDLLIEDSKLAVVDRNGSLDPWKNKNPNLGHSFDEWRYFLWANFNEISSMIDL
jgi:hypothetical protein